MTELIIKDVKAEGIKLILENNNEEIARAFLYMMKNDLHDAPFGFMEDVFVRQDFRGKGLGAEMVSGLIDEARRRECYKLLCTCRHSKEKVIALYKGLGFYDQGLELRMDF